MALPRLARPLLTIPLLTLPLLLLPACERRDRFGSAPPLADAASRGGAPDAAWRTDPLWDDGQAEFSAYEVTWKRYGHLYPGRTLLVLVKEQWAPDLDVKADRARPDGFDVLKCNHVRDVPTGVYTYHQTASVYLRRDSGALVKLASTSSEACGISTALLVDGTLHTHSYFDGEGDRSQDFPARAVPEDGLPALLRDYVRGEPPERLDVFPMLLMGRFSRLQTESFRVHKRSAGTFRVPAGAFDAVEITLESGETTFDGGETKPAIGETKPAIGETRLESGETASETGRSRLSYFFETALPHRLLLFRGSDGTEYRLVKSERIPYWRMHDPGDESWLPESLREQTARRSATPEAPSSGSRDGRTEEVSP